MRSFLLFASLLFACGGQVASGGDGGTPDSSVPPKDAGPASDVVAPPPSPDCASQLANIDKLSQDARTCCPFCNSLQCSHTVQGLCCPIPITADSDAPLTAAITKFKADCPAQAAMACQGGACAVSTMPTCVPVGSSTSMGTCQ